MVGPVKILFIWGMNMGDEKVEAILDNEREWRRYMMNKVDKLTEDMTGLKVKVASISALCGLLSGAVTSFVIKILAH